jgi:hypothetical protein
MRRHVGLRGDSFLVAIEFSKKWVRFRWILVAQDGTTVDGSSEYKSESSAYTKHGSFFTD